MQPEGSPPGGGAGPGDYDESIFKLRLSQIRDNINQSPYFEVEEIGYILPDKLRIQVHERAERR